MTENSGVEDGEDAHLTIPRRGGPIYVPNMVGPLIRVSDFESLVFNELQGLRKEMLWDSIERCDDDISVDELKIITEEELVDKAFEVAFKDGKVTGNPSQLSEKQSNAGKTDDGRISSTKHACLESSGRGTDGLPSNDSSNGSPLRSGDDGEPSQNISKKRKRKRCIHQKNDILEESYIEKVEQLARIKQKQDEDKASARLHSFKCGHQMLVNMYRCFIQKLFFALRFTIIDEHG